jgi:uncharacterized protein YbaP (TraB family)
MRRLLILALLLLTCSGAAQADAKHFLWRVSKDGHVMYVAGSVHVLRPEDYPLPAVMESLFRSSAGLVEEIDLTHFDPEGAQLQMMKIGAYPPGQSLKTALPPAVYARVTALAQKQKVDMEMLEPMRPWLASIVLLDNQLVQEGFDSASGVDIHFADEAEGVKKPVIGLEQASYQLGLLAKLPEKAQQDMLVQSLDDARNLDQDMHALLEAWHAGDTAALEKELHEEFGPYPEIYASVVVERNRAWMPKLESLAASGKQYFVVVGALHLVGPDGLLAHFQKDGFKVEQL